MASDFAWRCRSVPQGAKGARQVRRELLAAEQREDEAALAARVEGLAAPAVQGAEVANPIRCLPSLIWTVTESSQPKNSKPSSP